MNCIYSFSQFINNVYNDLGNPASYSLSRLSGWFLDNSNVGKLNNLIGTHISGVCFQNSSGAITGYGLMPEPSSDQYSIYKIIFDCEYFKNEARSAATSSMMVGNDWTELSEGDSSIKKINKNEISKNFRGLAQDCKAELDKATKMYLKYNSIPDQVAGDDTQGVYNYIIKDYQRTLN